MFVLQLLQLMQLMMPCMNCHVTHMSNPWKGSCYVSSHIIACTDFNLWIRRLHLFESFQFLLICLLATSLPYYTLCKFYIYYLIYYIFNIPLYKSYLILLYINLIWFYWFAISPPLCRLTHCGKGRELFTQGQHCKGERLAPLVCFKFLLI